MSNCCGEHCHSKQHHHKDEGHSCSCGCHQHEDNSMIYLRLAGGVIVTLVMLIFHLPSYLILIPYFILGYDILWTAIKNIFKGKFFDETFLMSIATIGAIFLGEYTEACAVMFFYQAGELIGHKTEEKCRNSIKKMFDFAPDSARRITKSGFEIIKPSALKINDCITVFAGEKIPCDGIVYSGESYVDTSSLTGESMPLYVKDGVKVLGGAINNGSPINVRVTAEYKDSSVAKVVRMLEEASKNKAKSEKFMTAFAKKYTPAVVGIALLSAIILPFIPSFDIKSAIYTALMFLVISCPCALVISIPLTLFAGVGNASDNKILFKGNNSLEKLYKIKNFAFDKTGTLTNGKFSVTEKTITDEEFSLLAHTERYSRHPLANIISDYAKAPYKEAKGITEIKGMGISATVDDKKIVAGNGILLKMNKIENISDISGTAVHLAIDGEYRGYVKLSDGIKENALNLISYLKKRGVSLTIISGDSSEAVKEIANKLDISDYYAELLPEKKVEIAKLLKEKGKFTYVGDGINDAPVLAMSDIGISMGGAGADIAMANSDIILLDDSLKSLEKAIKISGKTMRILYQNIIFSVGIKVLVMILGFLGLSSMSLAVFADVGVMILAILNAVRARR